ncbi:MAG: tRNA lysidine(34) synthetase TilS [Clostridia bacterium]
MKVFEFPKNSKLTLALSGGVDSMVMLHLLLDMQKTHFYVLKGVTVNHNIRLNGENDALFTKQECKMLGVECDIITIDAPKYAEQNKISIETAARTLRLKALYKYCDNCDYLCFAHHANDQAETVLMHIMRGSGNKGAVGMKQIDGKIARPLLHCSRNEIETYAKLNSISHVDDETNVDTTYRRNYVRHNLVPIMEERYGNAVANINKYAMRAQIDEDYFEKAVMNIPIESDGICATVNVETFKNLHPAIQIRVAMKLLDKIDRLVDAQQSHLLSLCDLSNKQSGKLLNLHNGVIAQRVFDKIEVRQSIKNNQNLIDNNQNLIDNNENLIDNNQILIDNNENIIDNNEILIDNNEISINNWFLPYTDKEIDYNGFHITVSNKPIISSNFNLSEFRILRFDKDKVPQQSILRLRKEGDFFKKYGGKTKKLKDFFIERQVPLHLRNSLPLISIDSEILMILGVEISDRIKIYENTKNKGYITIKKK